jgi:hypothetical protein
MDTAHQFTVIQDNPVQLPCDVIGIPPPTISWYQFDEIIEETDNFVFLPNGAFRIKRVRVEDGGTYECLATSEAGNDTKLITLVVQGLCLSKPSFITLLINISKLMDSFSEK